MLPRWLAVLWFARGLVLLRRRGVRLSWFRFVVLSPTARGTTGWHGRAWSSAVLVRAAVVLDPGDVLGTRVQTIRGAVSTLLRF
jgi:hypothetical protein